MILVVGKMGCCLIWLDHNQLIFNLFFILSFFQLTTCLHAELCPQNQSFALLQFKKLFSLDKSASLICDDNGIPSYPKLQSWDETTNCCSWDGVECDVESGHVIGLDLSCSWLYGTIHPNSSTLLFSNFPHLQTLNLAFNDFNNSPISSAFTGFTRLTHLNLSDSGFSGEISSEISLLSKLTSLDLSRNYGLRLKYPGFHLLVRNLTQLRELCLGRVNISSVIPNSLLNLTSLTRISLFDCGLQGKFPDDILFYLPNLKTLRLDFNSDLTGHFPKSKLNSSSPLQYLNLRYTNFSGELPNSISNMKSLVELHVSRCKFSGSIPASLGKFTQITHLDLSENNFNGSIADVIPNLRNLVDLSLGGNNFSDPLLPLVANLTQLVFLNVSSTQVAGPLPSQVSGLQNLATLRLRNCSINGTIPSWVFTLPSLVSLDLSDNKFTGHINDFRSNSLEVIHLGNNKLHGTIPSSIFQLVNLTRLYLYLNDLSGNVELDMFSNLKNLAYLELSENSLSLNTTFGVNSTLPKFTTLSLSSCNISEFPDFLRTQENLKRLDLSNNRIQGQIPKWAYDHEKQLPWKNIEYLDLHSNLLQGTLPVPPPTVFFFSISNNKLTGEIPSSFCSASSLQILDLSNNSLSGAIPQCLGNSSKQLSVLDLRKNSFSGTIPNTFVPDNSLTTINFNGNGLEGTVPKSLVNCRELEVLDLGNNKISGKFPHWLENLPKLHVLVLRSNGFHGPMTTSNTKLPFPNLRVIDISYNDFTGPLPTQYFKRMTAMMNVDEAKYQLDYMGSGDGYYKDSVSLTIKGLLVEMEKVLTIFTAIDLSKNKFQGEIPKFIGKLTSIRGLNLSHNHLSGHIPTSLANLGKLESLDLSSNNLTGEIPEQLTSMTSLAVFNVSQNQLSGLIPRGNQFNTFSNDSYSDNFGLCGFPLLKKCNNSEAPPPMTYQQEDNSESPSEFNWKATLMGYGCGMVFGLSMGYLMFSAGKPKWLVKIIDGEQRKILRRLQKHAIAGRRAQR